MTIIVRLLGLPLEDIPQLRRWSDHSVALLSGVNTPEELMQHGFEVMNLTQYLAHRVDLAGQQSSNGIIGDLVAEAAHDSEGFRRNELVSILIQRLTAGNETTTSLIGSALLLMLQTPGLQQMLRDDPEKIEPFVEEALRLESPFYGHFRLVKKDTEIDGKPLPKGSRVMLAWAAANRDADEFAQADAVDLAREKPRAHVAFGYGIHHCIGAALARAEACIALRMILRRTMHIELAPETTCVMCAACSCGACSG